ncbi:EF-hand domain-containing protein [Roseospira navarrensis]|uniref:EF-hand domain-containing protein n=1 Tax=Roseospira navarrensis TaxID=140058 RepID=A0A7X2D2Z0_9PROT|nr:EF-hand domain-containing protein [Roseospira navarrensis]MQX36231.1 hypothetical protein [Roseospira navarrensis]
MLVEAILGTLYDRSAVTETARTVLAQRFQAADADGSGGLSRAEFADMRANGPGPEGPGGARLTEDEAFAQLDANADDALSLPELQSGPPRALSGLVSPEMMSALLTAQEDAPAPAAPIVTALSAGRYDPDAGAFDAGSTAGLLNSGRRLGDEDESGPLRTLADTTAGVRDDIGPPTGPGG